MTLDEIKPGQRIRVRMAVERNEGDWVHAVEGVVEKVTLQKTGSWYAHSKDNRFWLRRVFLRKDDGELSLLTLDQHSDIQLVADAPAPHNAT